jgi:hypothetical protein
VVNHSYGQRCDIDGRCYCEILLNSSKGRQALCEALPYYRSNQGASYHSDGLVRGLMLSHDAANRTYMDEEVIICRA